MTILKSCLIGLVIVMSDNLSYGQEFKIGPKAGALASLPSYRDSEPPEDINKTFHLGYLAGFAVNFPVVENWTFEGELQYARQGRRLRGGINDMFRNQAVFHYIELPFLARYEFPQNYKRYYVNLGGKISYLLGGKGFIRSFELDEAAVDQADYIIAFGPRPPGAFEDVFTIYITEPNRVQAGLEIGGGVGFDIFRNQEIVVDLRYSWRHSWYGRDQGIDVGLAEYFENFRTSEHNLQFTVLYLFDLDLGVLLRKGKSTNRTK